MARVILVADDDPDNRAILATALAASGYAVCQAQDGEQAVALALSRSPDLILMDLAMPKVTGWDAARRIKSMPQTKEIPIFAFTAFALMGDQLKALESGCERYISKPCVPRDVVDAVRARVGP